jgi:ABC-type oligopeptide transport system substrate-binding subunit
MQLDQISFELVGVLAESWSISKDARTTTVKLRSGIKWSDGIPFTPDLLEPEQAQAHSGRWAAEARAYAQAQLQTCWLYPRHNLAV